MTEIEEYVQNRKQQIEALYGRINEDVKALRRKAETMWNKMSPAVKKEAGDAYFAMMDRHFPIWRNAR